MKCKLWVKKLGEIITYSRLKKLKYKWDKSITKTIGQKNTQGL